MLYYYLAFGVKNKKGKRIVPMARAVLLATILIAASNLNPVLNAISGSSGKLDTCDFGQLLCDDEICVDRKSWCDGQLDCFDASDEQYCLPRPLGSDPQDNINNCLKELHFKCLDGKCIPKSARCDDFPDCSVGDDEENCDYYFERSDDSVTTESTEHTTEEQIDPISSTTQNPVSATEGKYGIKYLLDQRDEHWGWGKSTAQIIAAIFLVNKTYFHTENMEGLLTKKQLEVLFAIDVMRREEVHLKLQELSHYLHAFLVTCHNPRNFHGINMLKLLKKEINRRRKKKLFVTPLAYLALCNAGDVTDKYIRRMKNMAYRRSEEQRWLDIQAYALLTISCYSNHSGTSSEWKLLKKDVATNLTDWQQADGSFGSPYSTGLALQALLAANEPGTESSMEKARSYLVSKEDWEGSFGSYLDNFYVLPALNYQTMANIDRKHCAEIPTSALNIEAEERGGRKRKMYVHYSLWIGGEKHEMHTITLSLPSHSNFVEVMEAAQRINPKYRHEMWMGSRGPIVYSIAGKTVDVERNSYWTLYRKVPLPFRPSLTNSTATAARLRLLGASKYIKDIRKLHPKDGEHLAFWLKSYV